MITALNNSYYDHEDTINPVKYFLDVNQMFPANDFQKFNLFYIRENKFKVYNNYLNPNEYKEGWFYNLDHRTFDIRDIKQSKSSFLIVSFLMGDQSKIYESYTYSILDLFSDLGGAFEIFEIFGKLVIGYYANKLFYHYVVNCLNQQVRIIDPKPNICSPKENF